MNPVVSVIVPCRNEREHISEFLASVQQQTGIAGEWEILIADGMSDDGTWELLQEASASVRRLRVLRNEGRYTSQGLNLAIAEARGEFIVRMDVHSIYAPDYIASCLRVIRETGAANVGGAARTLARGGSQRAIAAAYNSRFAVGGARFHFEEYEGPVDTVTYGCWRREYVLMIGGFDEQMIRNQDDELNLRIRRSGGVIWQSPQIKSWYWPRRRLRDLFRQYYQYGYWKAAILRKHGQLASLRHAIPGLFVFTVLAAAVGGAIWRPLWFGGAILVATYLAFLICGGVSIAARVDWRLIARIPPTLATFHIAYGCGFWIGFYDAVRGRYGSGSASLTR